MGPRAGSGGYMDAPQNSSTPDFIDTTNPHGSEPLVSAEEIAAIARQALEDVSRSTAGSVGEALGLPPEPDVTGPSAPAFAEDVETIEPAAHVASPEPSSPWMPAASESFAHVPPAPTPAVAEAHAQPAKTVAFEDFSASDVTLADEAVADPLKPLRSAAGYAAQNPFGLALVSFAAGIFVGMMLPGRRSKPQEEDEVEAAA
jgi:hypothetical protein